MTEIKNENIEFNFDLPNISDILDEKVQINTIFHFGLVQNVLEEFIKRQNSMYQKINSLEVKFDSWSLTHDIDVDTDNINKIEIKRDSINREETENEKDENNENKQQNYLINSNYQKEIKNNNSNYQLNEIYKKNKIVEIKIDNINNNINLINPQINITKEEKPIKNNEEIKVIEENKEITQTTYEEKKN